MKWIAGLSLVVFALSLFLFFSTGHGIRCYVCNSFNDSTGCSFTSVSAQYLTDCSKINNKNATMCRKIRQWVDFKLLDMESNERVVRSCGYEKTERECYYRAGFGGRQDVCTCYTDECNAAFRAFMNWPTLLGLVLVAFVGVRPIV